MRTVPTRPRAAKDLAACQRDVERLRGEIADLRKSIATEVRTRRIVVVDEHGAERIYSEQRGHAVLLNVSWTTARGRDAVATLYADEGSAGLSVMCADTVVADICGMLESDYNDADIAVSGLVSFHDYSWQGDVETSHRDGALDVAGLRIRTAQADVVVVLASGARLMWPEMFAAGTALPAVGQTVDGDAVVARLELVTGVPL